MNRRVGDAPHIVVIGIVRLARAGRYVPRQHLLVFRQFVQPLAAGIGLGIGAAVDPFRRLRLGDHEAVQGLVLHGIDERRERGCPQAPKSLRHRHVRHRPGMSLVQPRLRLQPADEFEIIGLRAQLLGDGCLHRQRQVRPAVSETFRPRHAEVDHIAFEIGAIVGFLVETHLAAKLEHGPEL